MLPRAGTWLESIKIIIAVALIWLALSLINPYINIDDILVGKDRLPVLRSFLVVTIFFAFLYYFSKNALAKAFFSIAAALLVFSYFSAVPVAGPKSVIWHDTLKVALSEADKNQRILMVDLYADWCALCKELDHKTFSAPNVQEHLKEINLARLDFTKGIDPVIQERFKVRGLPLVLFLKPGGAEIPDSRIEGFLNAEEFIAHLNKVHEATGS